ncbi:MAG: DUF1206 domain-containing protein [Labedaea sp.]
MTTTSNPASAARKAKNNSAMTVLGRAGMVCYGTVYVVVAYLALRVAFGDSGRQADQKGALQEVAASTFGDVLLWVLAIGLLMFGPWQLLLAAVSYQWRTPKRKRVTKRIGAAIRGITGLALGIAAIGIATGDGGGSGNEKEQTFSAKVLELPAGRLLLGAIALVVIGFGAASVYSGARRSFMKDLETGELPSGTRSWVARIGMVGYIAKGVAVGIIGVLLGIAALRRSPGQAGGLDAALRTLAGQPFGSVLLVIMAIGFAAFGIFCFAAAKSQRT